MLYLRQPSPSARPAVAVAGPLALILLSVLLGSCAVDFAGLPGDLSAVGEDFDSAHESSADADDGTLSSGFTLVELEEDPCYESVTISPMRDVLVFAVSCAPQSLGVEVGDVLVGVSDGGYLGSVVSLEFGDSTLTAVIEPIQLAELVGDGSFSTEVEVNPRAIIDVSGKSLYRENIGGMLVESGFRAGSIVARGKLKIDGDIEAGSLKMYELILETDLNVDFEYYVAASGGHSFQKSTQLESFSVPFAFDVAGVPVVGRLHTAVIARARSAASSYVDVSIGYSSTTHSALGGRYESGAGWDGVATRERTAGTEGMQLDGNATWNGRVDIYVKPALRFYEVVSLEGKQGVHLRSYTQPSCEGLKWGIIEGYGGSVGIALTVFDWWTPDMSIQLPGEEELLLEGAYDLPGPLPGWLEAICNDENNSGGDDFGGGGAPNGAEGAGLDPGGVELEGDAPAATTWVQAQALSCDAPVSGDTASAPFASDTIDGYICNIGNYESPEVVYTWTAPESGPVRFELQSPHPTVVNHDLFVLEGTESLSPAAYGAACTAAGLNSLPFDAVAGTTYLLVIDGYSGDAGPYQAVLDCSP